MKIDDYEKQLFSKGIIYFTGDITSESMQNLSEKLLVLNEDKNFEGVIKLYINSLGGDLNACFGTIEIIKRLRLKIITIGIGAVCSSGLLLFMAGHYRVLTKNTTILSHAYYWGKEGKHHELKAARKREDLLYKRLINYYYEQTKLPKKLIEKKLLPEIDVYLTPNEALKYNLTHKII